jgi:hypothetical protein
MNIGDKVRFLKGNEQGVITRLLVGDLIEVEIEDGFQIPVLRREVVVVSKEEDRYFPKDIVAPPSEKKTAEIAPRKSPSTGSTPIATQGIFLAFTEINDRQLALYLINNTDFHLPFTVGEEIDLEYKGIVTGMLTAKNSVKLKEVAVQDFEKWPALVVQLLFHRDAYFKLREPLIRKMKFKAATFFKSKKTAPVINKQAFLYQIDGADAPVQSKPIDVTVLKESMYEAQPSEGKSQYVRPPQQVDLHIEHLTDQYDNMNKNEMLDLQLKTFEDHLDRAIATGMDEITFIHGIGSGALRNAIHKKLSKMTNIQYFKDAMREKFGYGATLVRIN